MKTVAIASQKGGTGKTTTAVHLATAATLAGYHAVVIDLDPQGSAATWGDDRGEAAPEVISGQASRLDVFLESAAKEGFDLVAIDTGPAADAAARRCAERADLSSYSMPAGSLRFEGNPNDHRPRGGYHADGGLCA